MPAAIVRLHTRPERLRADQAEQLRQMVLAFPNLPERAVGDIIATIDQQTASTKGWTFVMLSPADNARVVSWIVRNSEKQATAVVLWSVLFLHLRRDTGEIMQTRDELAETVGTRPEHVSRIMSELESFGAISRERIKQPGMKGPGIVRYRMNPTIATHQTGTARDKAQSKAPPLRAV